MLPRSYRLWTQFPILLAGDLHGISERAKGLGYRYSLVGSSQSGPHGAGRDQSCMPPLPVVVRPRPCLATALLEDQQQHPAASSSPVCKALLILDPPHPANFTHFISGSSFLIVLYPLVSACAVSSSWNSLSLVTNCDDGNTNDCHLLGTSL